MSKVFVEVQDAQDTVFGACAIILMVLAPLPVLSQERRGGRWDAQILEAVQAELAKHDRLRDVRASVEDGIVTLAGSVDLYRDKMSAEKKVRRQPHVAGVLNGIEVRSTVEDATLREMLAQKLRYDRIGYGIMFNNLTLEVKDGVVTVGGNVRDEPDRASAIAIIEGTQGVKDVVDDIKVAPVSIFDDEIRVRAARAIYGDPVLQKYALDPQAPIRIVVEKGRITLYGVVQSQMDRQIAETRARGVSGAFSVENRLVVAGSGKTESDSNKSE